MKRYYSLLFALVLSSFTTLQAQSTVSGTIIDSRTQEAVVGATVVILGTQRGTSTNVDGEYSLQVDNFPVSIRFSYIGYKTDIQQVSQGGTINVSLVPGIDLDEVVAVGNRGEPRTVLTSAVPVDNINAAALANSGQVSLEHMINFKVPSYNASNQTISDATAHFDVAELRNVGPSRTLVLINGKRKNQSALVYVNDTPGKGEVGVDMKSIPTSAIESVEVLRDGASAYYGSDAIAGVVNIILKERIGTDFGVASGITTEGDGLFYSGDVNTGIKLGNGGILNLTGSYYHQDNTNRAGEPGGDGLFGVVFGDDDILNGTTAWQQANPDLGMIVGQPEYDKYSLFSNYNQKMDDGVSEFYAFGGYTYRDGTSYALYRAPYWITDDSGLLTPDGQAYNGFGPTFETAVKDLYGTAGAKSVIAGWDIDMSFGYGRNVADYTVGNSINVSLGEGSPTSFDPGGYTFGSGVLNLDLSRQVDNITLLAGAEARREDFEVRAGQEESYIDGGAQSFPGLQPDNELSEGRTNVGAYVGADFDVTETFLLSGAARFENYSDFGSNLSWKLAARQMFAGGNGVVRASVSTGFRAPSLHQIYLSNVQTLVSGGTVSNQGTFNNVSSVIQGLGVAPLDAETSLNMAGGLTYRLSNQFSISADYYNIAIDDRVLFTGEVGFDGDDTTTNVVESILIDNSVTSIKFFVNALDTKTQGVDFVLNYEGVQLGSSYVDLVWATNYNKTEIEGTINTPSQLATAGYDIFNRKEQSRVTTARPNLKSTLGATASFGKVNVSLNNTYFGEVTWQHGSDPANDQTFAGKLLTDLIISYDVSETMKVNLTGNNIFNVYPDVIVTGGDFVTDLGGRFKYPWEVNQFGFNGTVVRVGVNMKL